MEREHQWVCGNGELLSSGSGFAILQVSPPTRNRQLGLRSGDSHMILNDVIIWSCECHVTADSAVIGDEDSAARGQDGVE